MAIPKLHVPLSPLVIWRNLDRPLDWDTVFGRSAPLDLEIGFGRGEFFADYAELHPQRNLVAVEIRYPSINKGLRRLAKTQIENVRLVQEDAWVVLERLFSTRSVERMFALFPCPWPKKKHIKHRLFSCEFLSLMNSRLRDDGEIQIVTDFRPFLDWILEQVPGSGLAAEWEVAGAQFGTKYEDKWRSMGQEQFYDLRLRKTEHRDIPVKRDTVMNIHRIPGLRPELLRPQDFAGTSQFVKLKEIFHDPKQRRTMIRATVAEEHFSQGLWIEIKPKGDVWLISPARGCSVVPTPGVQRALDLVRDVALATNEGSGGSVS